MLKAIKTLIYAPTLLIALLSASVIASSDSRTDNLYSLSLRELLEVKIISSTLTGKNLRSVPSSVTVFTREQINNMGADYLYELVNFVPGFQAFRQGTDSLQYFHSARGHRSSVKSREILILLDGVRLIRETDNGAAIPMLALYNVQKIEFIRGPGSAIYGSNAFLGVINIETVRGKNAVRIAAGDANRKQFNSVSSYSDADFEFDLAVNFFHEQGETYTLQDINVTPLENVRASDPRNGGDLQFSGGSGDYSFSALVSRREAEDFYIVERVSSQENRSIHDMANIHVARQFEWGENIKSSLGLAYSENAFNLNTVIRGLGITRTNQEEQNVQFTVRNAWQYEDENSFEFGLELRASEMKSVYDSESLGHVEFYPATDRTITGLYLQNQRYYPNGLQLVVGGRFDHYSDSKSSFSPRLSLVYPLNAQQTVKLLYGEAFRAPTPNELYLIGVTLSGNPNLKPEIIKTSELVWVGQWGKHTTSLHGYFNLIENSIYSSSTFQNQTSNEEFVGLEAEYAYQPSQRWLIQANA